MKPVMASVTVTITLLVTSGSYVEAKELALDDCIELALQNRYSIIAARGAEDLAKANQRAALGAFLPRLRASYGYADSRERDRKQEDDWPLGISCMEELCGYQVPIFIETAQVREERTLGDLDRTSKSLSLSGSMQVGDLSQWFDYQAARAARQGAQLDVIESEQDLVYAVKMAYYAYLAAVQNVSVQEDAVKRSEEQLKLIESKYELGSASLSDVLKQKVLYGEDQLSLLSAQNAVTNTRAGLAYTIGVDPAGNVDFSTEFSTASYDGSLENAIRFGVEHKPGLQSARKQERASVNALRARRADYLPVFSLFGGISWDEGSSGFTATSTLSGRTSTVGFEVTWNLFDGFARERALASAKVDKNNASAYRVDTRNLVVSEIKTAYLEIRQREKQKAVAEENVAAADEDMKITQEKYNLGAATILDLLNAQVSLKNAQVSLIGAGFDLNLAIALLENAMGKM